MEKRRFFRYYEKALKEIKPGWLVLILGLAIFAVDIFILNLIEIPISKMFIDSVLLVIFLSPVLFFLNHEFNRRSQIECKLQEERDKFKAIFEGTGDGVRIIDPAFNILMVNQKMAELTGIGVDEQVGMKCYDSLSSEFCHTPSCSLKRILNGAPIVEEELLRTSRRGTIWMHHIATPMKDKDGNIVAIIEAFRDVTERKQIEEALREAEERYRTVTENSLSGIFMLQDGILKFVNRQFARIFGYRKKDLLETKFEKLIHPEDQLRFNQIVNGILNTAEVAQRIEFRGVKAGGENIIVGMTMVKIDYHGQPAVLGYMADITKRKQTEKELIESNKKLQQALDELKKMQAQLVQQEKMASIGQLAAGIAHEMNNPVGFVFSNFKNLRDYVEDFKTLLEQYQQCLQKLEEGKQIDKAEIEKIKQIEKEIDLKFLLEDIEGLFKDTEEGLKRLIEIIQNLREFSRVDQVGDYTEYDINEGIKSTLVIIKNEYKYHVDVKTELGNIPPIYCHPGQINEVLMNIILNAVQAIKSQNRKDKGTILIKTYSDKDYVYCAISDDGPGIPEEIRGKIFDPFFTTKPVGKGTGLGLSICYDIVVNKHKGEIWVESEVGKGSTFFIKLPIKNCF
ncbi:MAG: PAS domain S-box protein [Candidatus Desulfofervidaceae bacterium]|nr:PAS domain S-box protein [Candidatus Desulfofervidaceae bacterium]